MEPGQSPLKARQVDFTDRYPRLLGSYDAAIRDVCEMTDDYRDACPDNVVF